MDSMIKKWKKLIKNEKTTENIEETNQESLKNNNHNIILTTKLGKIQSSDNENNDSDFSSKKIKNKKSQKNNFTSSQISNHSEKQPRLNKFTTSSNNSNNKSFSNSLNKKFDSNLNNSNHSLSPDKKTTKKISISPVKNININNNINNQNNPLFDNLNQDKILKMLHKILNTFQKGIIDTIDFKTSSDDINEIINLYIKKLNFFKDSNYEIEQKQIILKTKSDTAERMIKDYEMKYLTAEKEKVNIFFLKRINLKNIWMKLIFY